MPRRPLLTFANVASATALVIATTGGGFAVAAGLANNSVGSAQIKTGAVKSPDIKNGSIKGKDVKDDNLTGKDIKESTLAGVDAATVNTVASKTAVAAPGQTAVIYSKGSFVIEVACVDLGAGNLESTVTIRTTADNALFDANDEGDEFADFDVATGRADIVTEASSTTQDIEDGGFGALSAAGQVLTGHTFAVARPAGAANCLGGGSFIS